MDRSQDVFASLSSAVFAGLRAATTPGHSRRDGESDGLHTMLSNPDFIPPPLRLDNEVRSHPPAAYDDLPPLEDDVEPSSASNPPGEDLPNQDADEPPPLEADDSSPLVTSPQPTLMPPNVAANSSSSDSSASTSTGLPSSTQPSVSRRSIGASTTSGRATSRPARATVNAEDPGAESDSSLPSLQSVSDSSSDEEDYISESGSEWDDDESLDGSEEEADIARLVEEAEAAASEAQHNPTGPNPPAAAGVLPDFGPTPNMFHNTLQSYRELLDRARVLIPDIDVRLGPPPDWVVDITNRLSAAGADNDSERAETLIRAMEVVPDELVLRYEKLRSTDGEDVDGCAICRDDLVDKSPETVEASRVLAILALLPFPFEADTSVAFPCGGKHLFHKHCLLPWLARKTTCPSCRFDIDPHSLTLRISRGLHDILPIAPQTNPTHSPRAWQPPQVESISDWLAAEERARETGVPRVRPEVIMPEYPVVLPSTTLPPTTLPPTGPSPSEMLGLPAWGTDPETGRFDMTIAYRDIQDLREHLLDIEDRRRAAGLPNRPPSAPPVATSEASLPFPEDVFPENDFPDVDAAFRPPAHDSEYQRLRQQIAIERHGAHVVPFHNFPASLMDHVVNLTSRPVARGPPPNNVDVDALANIGRRLDSLGSLEMYSQVLRNFQSMRRSANPLQPAAPPPAPAAPIATVPTQNNPPLTAIAPNVPADSNTPHPVPGTMEDPSVGSPSTTNGNGSPPSARHNPMEELD
ncbi:hypothetical protein V8D89_011386 [Ganoderma adspersum]